MPTESQRLHVLARHIQRNQGTDFQLFYVYKVRKATAKGTTASVLSSKLPLQRLSSDLFDYNGCQYLLVADYFSKFPVMRKLSTTTSSTIIHHLRSILAEHIPEDLVTDNVPQYSSHEFEEFCSEWGIKHTTSSPLYPQSNGFSERMAQTVKNLLKKSEEA